MQLDKNDPTKTNSSVIIQLYVLNQKTCANAMCAILLPDADL